MKEFFNLLADISPVYYGQEDCIANEGHVNEYPTMHYFIFPRHTQSMIAYKILSISGNSSEKLHCGNVVNMP